jgi:hypothetical protein
MTTRGRKMVKRTSPRAKSDAPAIAPVVDADAPLVIDLGKKGRKQIKRLRKGTGKLVAEVQRRVEELQSAGTLRSSPPVVLVMSQKRRRPYTWF